MFWCAVLVFAGTATVSQSARNFTLVTFNTGLTPSNLVPFYQERRDALKTHLATSSISADVLCLQELFRDKDITDLVDATRHQFPYHYRASSGDRQNPSNPPCSQSALGAAFGGCLTVNCSTALARGFLSFLACAFTTCYSDVSSFGQECVNCITNQNPQSSSNIATLLLSGCAVPSNETYLDNHGLLLLSKIPLSNTVVRRYHPGVVEPITRGYLAADIEELGTVTCTHLSTQGGLPYYVGPPQFNNFEDLQENETMQLLQTYPATSDKHSILLGDFNQGPAVFSVLANRNLSGQYESNYWKVINSGYISAYVDDVTLCTSCGENGLRNLTGSSDSKILDHIYVRNGSRTRVSNVQRIWDSESAVGSWPLSDHYGVQLTYLGDEVDVTTQTDLTTKTMKPTNETQISSAMTSVAFCLCNIFFISFLVLF